MRGNPISQEQRKRMYEMFLTGKWTQAALAKEFGCSEWALSQVISSQLPSKLKRKAKKPVHQDPLPKSKYRTKGGRIDIPKDNISQDAVSVHPMYAKLITPLTNIKSS